MDWTNIVQVFDQHRNHWLEAVHPAKGLVRGEPAPYRSYSELGELRGQSAFYGAGEQVFFATPVTAGMRSCVTPFKDNSHPNAAPNGEDWRVLWRRERDAALAAVPVYQP